MKNKLVKVANVRKHMDAHFRDEISYTEAVSRINKDALKALGITDVGQSFKCPKCKGKANFNELSGDFICLEGCGIVLGH